MSYSNLCFYWVLAAISEGHLFLYLVYPGIGECFWIYCIWDAIFSTSWVYRLIEILCGKNCINRQLYSVKVWDGQHMQEDWM